MVHARQCTLCMHCTCCQSVWQYELYTLTGQSTPCRGEERLEKSVRLKKSCDASLESMTCCHHRATMQALLPDITIAFVNEKHGIVSWW